MIILGEVAKNENLRKLIYYSDNNPLELSDVHVDSLFFKHLFPYPFDPSTIIDDCTQLRVWAPECTFKHRVIEDIDILFDVIISRNLNIIYVDGSPKLRAVEIMSEIIEIFNEKSIETIGMLRFTGFTHMTVNEKFDCYRLFTEMMNIS